MKMPNKLYVVVCDEWDGNHYVRQNCRIYFSRDTATMAAEIMQDNHKLQDLEFWVDEVDFCGVIK